MPRYIVYANMHGTRRYLKTFEFSSSLNGKPLIIVNTNPAEAKTFYDPQEAERAINTIKEAGSNHLWGLEVIRQPTPNS